MRQFKETIFLIVISIILIGLAGFLSCMFQFWLIDYIIGCVSGVLLGIAWIRFIQDIDEGVYTD